MKKKVITHFILFYIPNRFMSGRYLLVLFPSTHSIPNKFKIPFPLAYPPKRGSRVYPIVSKTGVRAVGIMEEEIMERRKRSTDDSRRYSRRRNHERSKRTKRRDGCRFSEPEDSRVTRDITEKEIVDYMVKKVQKKVFVFISFGYFVRFF